MFSSFLMPLLRTYEKRFNAIFAVIEDAAEISGWVLGALLSTMRQALDVVLAPVWRLGSFITWPSRLLRRRGSRVRGIETESDVETDGQSTRRPAKTPRKERKPRYSQVATPHVPGHLVAEASAYPPVQPRLDPAERSLDDLPAFQEALDRAQAAFYEASPERMLAGTALNGKRSRQGVISGEPGPSAKVSQRISRRRKVTEVEDASTIDSRNKSKRRKAVVIDEDAGETARIATNGASAGRHESGRSDSIDQPGQPCTNGSSGSSRLPLPALKHRKAFGEAQKSAETAVTRSGQRARETALAARKRAPEEALARKGLANQVDSRIAKRKKAL